MFKRLRALLQEFAAYLTFWPLLGGAAIVSYFSGRAAYLTEALQPYAPASWVAAGLLGLLVSGLTFWLLVTGRVKWVRAKYDAKMLARGLRVDPMQKTFERARIFLNEFALPSHPLIENKTFIDCEIIGPANILLLVGNSVNEIRLPFCDAVLLSQGKGFVNGYTMQHCTFRGCSFQRITFFVPPHEYPHTKNVNWLNWITDAPSQQEMKLIEGQAEQPAIADAPSPQSPPNTEPEKRP